MNEVTGNDIAEFVNKKNARVVAEAAAAPQIACKRAAIMIPIENYDPKNPVFGVGIPDPGVVLHVGFSERPAKIAKPGQPAVEYTPVLVCVVEPRSAVHHHEFVLLPCGSVCADEHWLNAVCAVPSPWGMCVLFEKVLPEELRKPVNK